MQQSTWPRRYAWILFVLAALSGLVPGLMLLASLLSAAGFVNTFGHPVPQAILSDAAERAFLEFLSHWVGTVLIGSNLLTVFIAATAFRKGERWAWLAFWYWPFMFAAHFLMYTGGFKVSQVIGRLLTAGALLWTNPYASRRGPRPLRTGRQQ
ncbi:MAG: hypothetical protein KatS3mg050_0828 [Litorilinea sp.]|nr:MAG: hypothetical protein KatS3mg050_0828 [Litorilinea sp.]